MCRESAPIAAEIRATLAIAAPLAGGNLAQMAMQVTNTVMVGHLGAVALAAAGLGGSIYSTVAMMCQGVLAAVAPLIAHAIGADDYPVAGAGLILAAVLAVPVVAILTAMPYLLAALGYAPDLVIEIGRFLRTVRWGVPACLGAAMISAACGLLGAPDQSPIHRSTSKPASSMSKDSCSPDGDAICDSYRRKAL